MAFEQYKTQVLLLHSQQGTLDNLSAGFNDNFSVHCATSGSEALNTLGETPIHVIVSAQDLPGMSGLEALREAKKRSPDTIGILLAGSDKSDGLEALVGAKEVFRIVREKVTPESLLHLVESATQQARLLALAESANDNAANLDMPVSEEIVMETLENGSLIISDGTNRLPALNPQKIQLAPDVGARNVDLLVMTRDEEFLATITDSARGLHHLHHALTAEEAEKIARNKQVGVLITDAAMVGSDVHSLTEKLRKQRPRLVAIVAGRRDDGEMLMDLINRGHVYRFLLKPVSPGRARLAIEASVKHHIEAPDDAFRAKALGRSPPTRSLAKAKPARQPAPKPVARPASAPKPKPAASDANIPVLEPESKRKLKAPPRPAPKSAAQAAAGKAAAPPRRAPAPARPAPARPAPKLQTKPQARPAPPGKARRKDKRPLRIEPTISAPSATEPLYDAGKAKRRIQATMSGLARSVDKTLASAGSLASGAQDAVAASGEAVAGAVGGALEPLKKPSMLKIAGGAIAACALALWLYSNRESILPAILPQDTESVVADFPEPGTDSSPALREPNPGTAAPEVSVYEALLAEARRAAEAGNLIEPRGFSAVELYLQALREAPGDAVAADELGMVIERVLGLAEAAILAENTEDASDALTMVRLADPGHSRLGFLDAQLTQVRIHAIAEETRLAIRNGQFDDAGRMISEARSLAGGDAAVVDLLTQELAAARVRQKVDESLELAGKHLEAGNLVSPSNDNARYYYELALANDPGNQSAQQGLEVVAARLAEAERQAETARLAEIERQAELARQAEAERQAQLRRQAELDRQAEEARLAEIQKQQEEARLDAIRQQQEQERLAQVKEAERRNAEQRAAAAATAATLGVAGSKVKEPVANAASAPAAPRTPPAQSVSRTANAAPPPETLPAETATADMPTATLPLTAGVVEGARTFGMENGGASPAAAGAAPRVAAGTGATGSGSAGQGSASDGTVPISALTRTNYVAPEFPRSAQRKNLSGSVDVSFTVTTIGTVTDVSVIRGEPEGVFDQAAIDAVSQWRFDPVIENGVALEKRTAVRLSFALE